VLLQTGSPQIDGGRRTHRGSTTTSHERFGKRAIPKFRSVPAPFFAVAKTVTTQKQLPASQLQVSSQLSWTQNWLLQQLV